MPHTATMSRARQHSRQNASRGRLQQYRFEGASTLTFCEDSDLNAFKRLADHFGIPFPITLESFAGVGGKRLTCEGRQIFPPPSADA